jgi:hypothetical protein
MTTARNAFIAACGQPTGALPLVTRTRAPGPIGWLADVMYVPSSENRSHGESRAGGAVGQARSEHVMAFSVDPSTAT